MLPVDLAPALDDVDIAAPVDDVGLAAPLDDVDLSARIDDVACTEVSIIFSFPFAKLTLFPLISYAHRSHVLWWCRLLLCSKLVSLMKSGITPFYLKKKDILA
jgi:hypothetical protein